MSKSRLSKQKQKKMIEYFVVGVTARSTSGYTSSILFQSEILGLNENAVCLYFYKLRLLIYKNSQADIEFAGKIEIDESYFGGFAKGKEDEEQVEKLLFLEY